MAERYVEAGYAMSNGWIVVAIGMGACVLFMQTSNFKIMTNTSDNPRPTTIPAQPLLGAGLCSAYYPNSIKNWAVWKQRDGYCYNTDSPEEK